MVKQTQKEKSKEAVAKFEASDGTESYITGKAPIPKEWDGVAEKWQISREHAKDAITLFVEIGDQLLPIREATDDTEFGKQRKLYAPQLSRNDARRAMRMAENRERFLGKPNRPKNMALPSLSVYAELFTASDALVEKVKDATADPDAVSPTVKEVREAVKAEKPETAEDFAASIVPPSEPIDVEQITEADLDAEEREQLLSIMNHPIKDRIKILREEELDTTTALVLCGLNPYYDGDTPCHIDVFYHLVNGQMYEKDMDSEEEILTHEEMGILATCRDDLIGSIWS